MAVMKIFPSILCAIALAVLIVPARAAAQSGSIEFVALVTPSAGVEEPVRDLPFYLLSKSYDDITKEARAQFPGPDMDAFIDKLNFSPELKIWMKKHHWVRFRGEDFVRMLSVDDIMNVPEFFTAYVKRMSGDQTVLFPTAKYKTSDKEKDPAKYKRLSEEYQQAVRKFLVNNPTSTQGLDLELEDLDPSHIWNQLVQRDAPELQREIQALAQSKYFVARTQTDLQGQGVIRKIPVGNYWLSTLGIPATVGDARLKWDTPVSVRAGQTTYVNLTNANSVPGTRNSP
jgi:hypothetical protein